MLLTIDVRNTHTVVGLISGSGDHAKVVQHWRIRTESEVTSDELARAITASEAEREFSRETVEGLALAYGRAETTWNLEEERAYVERVRKVTRAEVQAAAGRYLTASYARLTFVPRTRTQ